MPRADLRPEERGGGIVADAGHGQPGGQLLDRFQVQRRGAFLAALAGDVEDAVLAVGAEIADAEPDQLADAAAGIGQHGEHGPVADADREIACLVRDGQSSTWGASSKRRQSCGDRPTVLPSRGTAGAATKSLWAGLAPV